MQGLARRCRSSGGGGAGAASIADPPDHTRGSLLPGPPGGRPVRLAVAFRGRLWPGGGGLDGESCSARYGALFKRAAAGHRGGRDLLHLPDVSVPEVASPFGCLSWSTAWRPF